MLVERHSYKSSGYSFIIHKCCENNKINHPVQASAAGCLQRKVYFYLVLGILVVKAGLQDVLQEKEKVEEVPHLLDQEEDQGDHLGDLLQAQEVVAGVQRNNLK